MNYEHEYHAGNHTEVFKHSALILLLETFKKKSTPFFFLDTHGGQGLYRLDSEKALKTRESSGGVELIIDKPNLHFASSYVNIVRELNPSGLTVYPGSTAIAAAVMRRQDRLAVCELRQSDYHVLKRCFASDRRVSVHHRNGYEALRALVPPKENRGIVFIDPPFENENEFDALAAALISGVRKWRNGVFIGWYPIKDLGRPHLLEEGLRGADIDILSARFCRYPVNGARLAGSGLVICNPPWKIDSALSGLCSELTDAFEIKKPNWFVKTIP